MGILRNRLFATTMTSPHARYYDCASDYNTINFEFSIEQPDTFDFIGPQCINLKLEGGQEMSIPMQAVIHSPGVYDLQNVKLSLLFDEYSGEEKKGGYEEKNKIPYSSSL